MTIKHILPAASLLVSSVLFANTIVLGIFPCGTYPVLFYCAEPYPLAGDVSLLLALFVSLFVLSIIAYFLRQRMFKVWLVFVCCWIPLSVIIIFTTPHTNPGFLPIPDQKPFSALIQTAVLIIVSAAIFLAGLIAGLFKKGRSGQ